MQFIAPIRACTTWHKYWGRGPGDSLYKICKESFLGRQAYKWMGGGGSLNMLTKDLLGLDKGLEPGPMAHLTFIIHARGPRKPQLQQKQRMRCHCLCQEKNECCNNCYKKKNKKNQLFAIYEPRTLLKLRVKEDPLPPTALDVLCVAENIHPHHQMGRIFKFLFSLTVL